MVNRIVITLEQPEYSALLQVASDELRNPQDQARFILRQVLENRGLLESKEQPDEGSIDVEFKQSSKGP